MTDENVETNPPGDALERNVIGSLAEIAEIATPVVLLAQPLVAKLVNQAAKEEAPTKEVVLPPAVSGD